MIARDEQDGAARSKLLVAEDEALIRLMLVDALEDDGFDVLEAENVAEAIAMLERHDDIRLVISDIRMPGDRDGIDLARWVRTSRPGVKVVLASGYVSTLDQPALAGTVDHFASKPYRIEELIGQVRRLL